VTEWFWLYEVTGVELLLCAKLALSPGLAQPPPRLGEGERESDMVRGLVKCGQAVCDQVQG
jgi:hypothetical protein